MIAAMLTGVFAEATDVIAYAIVYFILFGVPLIALVLWWDYRRWRKAQYREWLQSVTHEQPNFDAFGRLPVLPRFGVIPSAFMVNDLDPDFNGSPVSYTAGRYPESGVQRMMLNGQDYPLNEQQIAEMEVWGTIDGIPIEDFDDWSDWS